MFAPDASLLGLWLTPALFGLCFAGLGYVIINALHAGADAYANEYSQEAARQFEDIFLFIPPQRITDIAWSLACAIFILIFFSISDLQTESSILTGLTLGAIAGAGALKFPTFMLSVLRRRRRNRFNMQLVDALLSMSSSLKAGFSISQAIEAVVQNTQPPISQEFAMFLHETRVGVPFDDALQKLVDRVGSDDLVLVAAAIETARITGGNLTDVLDNIAATIRERLRIEGRVHTLTAQGRLQGIVIGVMPFILAGMLIVIDRDMMMPFLRSTVGLATIGVVLILETLGFLTIRKIVQIDI